MHSHEPDPGEGAPPESPDAGAASDERPRRARRRRRRGGGRSADAASQDRSAAEAGAFADPPPVNGERSGGDGEAADKPGRRKKRRRRRTRRTRKPDPERAPAAEADTEAPPVDAEVEAPPAPDDEGTPRKRRRTRRRRGRKRDADLATEADADIPPLPDDDAPPEEGASKAKGDRPRRRKKKKKKRRESKRRKRGEGRREVRRGESRKSDGRRRDPRAIDIVPRAPDPSAAPKEKVLLVNATDREEARIALLVDGVLEEVYVETTSTEKSSAGHIYRGRVQNVEPGIGAAFVDLGRGLTGFLHASDLPLKEDETPDTPVTERLTPGDEVIVQITRDSIGRKGPALTGRISFPGRYLVLMPHTGRSGISRRIPQGSERERVRKLLRKLEVPEGMGVIVRTASETTDAAALGADLDHLLKEWEFIKRKAAEPGQPGLLRGESDLAERSVRDIMPGDVTRIIVDKEEIAGQMHRLLRVWYPSAAAAADEAAHAAVAVRSAALEAPIGEIETAESAEEAENAEGGEAVDEPTGDDEAPGEAQEGEPEETEAERMNRLEKLAEGMPDVELHTDPIPLFHRHGAETQLEDAFRRTIRLPSGGSIVIDPTEALVAVDVNSGRLTGETDPEATALVTNLEAVVEAARQLRLRDLGGLIVIDFIDMRDRRSRRKVEIALRDALSNDRARIRMGRMGPFGLVVLSRQRIRQALSRLTHEACNTCGGTGHRRLLSGLGLRVLREMQARVARSRGRGGLEVRAPDEVIGWLKKHRGSAVKELRKACSGPINLEADTRLATDGWAMKGLPPSGGEEEADSAE